MPALPDGAPPAAGNAAAAKYSHGLSGVNLALDADLTNAAWALIATLIGIVLIGRLIQLGNDRIRLMFSLNAPPVKTRYWETDKTTIWPWLKKNVLYAPMGRKRHNREFQLSSAMSVGTLPSRLHSAILISYCLLNMIYMMFLAYREKPQAAILAELRGRSGHLSLVNMLPLIVLAGRNNPLIPLLRVSFDTFNLIHRWLGRLVILEALIHTACWAANSNDAHGAKATNAAIHKSAFLGYGMVGTVAMGIILVQSPSVVRHAFYEIFIHVHQALAIASIIGVWIHVQTGKLPSGGYVKWAAGMWLAERLFRLIRLLNHNVSRSRGMTTITVEALPGAGEASLQAIRLSASCPRPWKFTPGTHAYIYIPKISFWMNHPFSIAWSSERYPTEDLDNPFLPASEKEMAELKGLPTTTTITTAPARDADLSPYTIPTKENSNLHFVIAKRTGMTATLYNAAMASPSRTITLRALIEGPYGGTDSLSSYGTVILFAGGIGITHQIGHIRHLLHGAANGTTATRKIVLIWSVKNTETLEWVRPWMDEVLRLPNRKQILKVMLFVTKPRCAREVISRSNRVLMYPGRANPTVILEEEVREREGAMAVTVCGPGAFGDEVRKGVRDVLARKADGGKGATIDFVEEAFSW